MVKIKNVRTADCVVGGFRYAQKERIVGLAAAGAVRRRRAAGPRGLLLQHHPRGAAGADAPAGGAARAARVYGLRAGRPQPLEREEPRSTEWEPLAPELVVEVGYDHFTGGRFRHGTRFYRWRPDKAPEQCTYAQLGTAGRSSLRMLDV